MADRGGVMLLRGAVGAGLLAQWRGPIERRYALARERAADDPDFNRYSASLRLAAVDGIELPALLRQVLCGALLHTCRQRLGERLVCNVDQCWVRRQYAPGMAPPLHAPHGWHQDGALRADFAGPIWPEPLTMLTCWIALTPCGRDAPGLQWVDALLPRLLAPADLSDARVQQRFATLPWQQPEVAAGDALLFDGCTLHRTHVTAAMTATRTSLELRVFAADALPARLAGERFVALG